MKMYASNAFLSDFREMWKTAAALASVNSTYLIHHLNIHFQDLQQDVVHPGEPEQEVGVPGGQGNRLQVIVHIPFRIHVIVYNTFLTVFFMIYI